jgi:hypothetical protein
VLVDYVLNYNAETECPKRYHQWCYMSAVAALLGRNVHLRFGHGNIMPNHFMMLIGSPAARKSTAIKIITKLLKEAGYDNIAQGRTSKEKFLLDLSGHKDDTGTMHTADNLSSKEHIANLFDSSLEDIVDDTDPHETLIAADEFTNFIGSGNYEFISLLGELWDNPEFYDNRVKNSKSFRIHKPCVNILGGNTPTGFANAFPPEILGQGFASRLLLIYGERTNIKITWPEDPDIKVQTSIVEHFMKLKASSFGEISIDKNGEAFKALDWLYKNWAPLEDTRFANYSGRRFSHLLKLALLFTCNALRSSIELEDVVAANTLLAITEDEMPQALGEFGRAKNSALAQQIVEFINNCKEPVASLEVMQHVGQDVSNQKEFSDVLLHLQTTKKIQRTAKGFLPIRKAIKLDRVYFDLQLIGGI